MKHSRVLIAAGCVAACSMLSGCATFFYASGGGPLDRSSVKELLAPADASRPSLADMKGKADGLRNQGDLLAGKHTQSADSFWLRPPIPDYYDARTIPFVPVRNYQVSSRINGWARMIPSVRNDDILFFAGAGKREFYAPRREWGAGMLIADFIYYGERSTAFELTTGIPVAMQAHDVCLTLLGYVKTRVCYPANAAGEEGLHLLADPATDIAAATYNVKESTLLLGGLVGWGRVNHRKYMQILFIPFPTGQVDSVPAASAK